MKDWSISSLKWKWSRSVVSDSLRPHGLTRSSIHGIFQARVLEWAAISFSRGSSWPRDWTGDSHIVGRHITIWATQEVWTISQMSDQNSFPHSSLEWICQLSFTHRGSQEVSPLATNQESVYIWHSVKFSGFNTYEHHITQQTGYFLPSPVVVSNLVVIELYATIFQ